MLKKYSDSLLKISSSVLAIFAGLLFGFIILLIANPNNAFEGFGKIMAGGFPDGISGIAYTLYLAAPIIMTGLSVGFAFKTGLFNIGVTGQLTVAAFVAVYVGVKGTFIPGFLLTTVAILAAFIAGALWGMIPSLLKAYANVNEVISSILLNYIAMYLVNMLIPVVGIYNQLKNQTVPVLPDANLAKLVPNTNLNAGILVALLFTIVVYVVIQKTAFGYELKACGLNRHASKYAGINEKRSIVLSMMIAGGLAGVGGALLFLSGTGRHIHVVDVLIAEGFSGISVALLGQSNPIGIFFAGLFIAHITRGGSTLQLFGYTREIIDIIIAAIIYFGAFSLLFLSFIKRFQKRRAKKIDGGGV